MSQSPVPPSIGRYRIEGVLGEGAMAVVYAGFDPSIDRRVAIKCLHREVADDPEYRQRFLVEARAAGQLTHPHIVTIFDTGETEDGRPYLAMERLSGETLASRVASRGLPSIPAIITLVSQLAMALDYAHARGVIHHDIKPDNIVLADGWHHAKISDFGIAERRGNTQDMPSGDRIGGTPAYMAPERLRGEQSEPRSDLFSLGVVLHWLVTGKLPWPDHGDVRQTIADRQQPLAPIEPRDPATPSMLAGIIATLLDPSPEARYQRGKEVADDLHAAQREYEKLQEQPLVSRFMSLRLRWAAALGATLTLVLMLGLALIYGKQSHAVTGLALDFGGSMGRMLASESAENLLLGDRAATRALVEDVARNQQIHYLAIADRSGEIIASTRTDEVSRKLPPASGQKYVAQSDDVQSYLSPDTRNEDGMLLFDVPVRYQDKAVGQLRLGISNAPLHAAQRTTLGVILMVLVLTLAAVMGAAYWLFRRPLTLLNLVSDAMLRVARGDFRYRIRQIRNDELGRLFAAFNLMNTALQNRRRSAPRPEPQRAVDTATQPTRILTVSAEVAPAKDET